MANGTKASGSLIPLRCVNPDCCGDDTASRPQFDFEATADAPVCPKCGADARDEEGRHVVHPLAVIHYMLIDRTNGKIRTANGRRSVACDPTAADIPVNMRAMRHGGEKPEANATGEPSSVTCPACKASEAWKADADAGRIQHKDIVKTK